VARKGFTLLELLMVIAVLAILASLSFGLLRVGSAQIHVTETRVHTLGCQVGTVAGLKGFPPDRLEDLSFAKDKPDWLQGGKFVDAWEHPFEYRVEGKKFRVWSCGPDGVSGTADDIEYKRN
jgi:prepilin-type N-terminal cleavage/methylation domain-containing protein